MALGGARHAGEVELREAAVSTPPA